MKKAQATVFILLGLLVLLVVVFFIGYTRETQQTPTILEPITSPIQTLAASCYDQVAEEAVFLSGFQGGYLEITDRKEDITQRQQAYYYYYQDISPNITQVYALLEAYILNNTITCIEESNFDQAYNISIEKNQASFSIASEETTTIEMHLPIQVETATMTTTYSEWTTIVPVPFERMYGVAQEIINTIEKSDPLICMSCIHRLGEAYGVVISITDYQQHSDAYVLFDPQHPLLNAPFAFAFLVRTKEDFDPSELVRQEKYLSLSVPEYTAKVGEEFRFTIGTKEFLEQVVPLFAKDPKYNVTFFDFTTLFDIDPVLGTIAFIPTAEQRGNHTVLIKIQDSNGDTEYTSLRLVIMSRTTDQRQVA